MDGHKLTLRNHFELFASDIGDIKNTVDGILCEIDSNTDEFIDDEIYCGMKDFQHMMREAWLKAWELENLCQEREMGKKRF